MQRASKLLLGGLCTALLTLAAACMSANAPISASEGEVRPMTTDQPQAITASPAPAAAETRFTVELGKGGSEVSDTMFGLFLEDINFAVDGGLYTERVKNRSFEYGELARNRSKHGWRTTSDSVTFDVRDGSADGTALNPYNPQYAVVTNASGDPAGIENTGFLDGIAVEAGKEYVVSSFILSEDVAEASVVLYDTDGTVYAEGKLSGVTGEWQRLSAVLTPSVTVAKNSVRLGVLIGKGTVCLDMVSMLPVERWNGLPIRPDLGETLKALHPSFLRFPGGCIIEGKDLESMYSWKDSIANGYTYPINGVPVTGDVSARKQAKDLWYGTDAHPYYMTYGLGFYEFFCLCEALDCLPVPVLNAGMTCQLQAGHNYMVFDTNSAEFKQCVQDALDLVEFCRGGADTQWGAVRIAMGHEAPFTLKYVAIGNEQWQREYFQHYEKFVQAFDKAAEERPDLYSDIELIVANGPASNSTEGWSYMKDASGAEDLRTTLVDEHYYEEPDWFLANVDRYAKYDRTWQNKVFLGEYAARSNTLRAALAEAAYMTQLEENCDVVKMACYAPLLCADASHQWTPDMIWFRNDSVLRTVNYYVQQLFMQHVGAVTLPSELVYTPGDASAPLTGGIGLGSWETFVRYDNLKVVSNADGAVLLDEPFDSELTGDWDVYEGNWSVQNGALMQKNTRHPVDENTGDAIYFPADWTDYTLTVDGTVLGGAEGFLIPVAVQDEENHIFWNIGGWGNTTSCLQIVSGGTKGGQVSGTVQSIRLDHNRAYQIRVSVTGKRIQCWLDDRLYIDWEYVSPETLYGVASEADNGDLILKLVSTVPETVEVPLVLNGFDETQYGEATVITLGGGKLSDSNTFASPDKLIPKESTMRVAAETTVSVPAHSLTIIRIPKN